MQIGVYVDGVAPKSHVCGGDLFHPVDGGRLEGPQRQLAKHSSGVQQHALSLTTVEDWIPTGERPRLNRILLLGMV